MWTEQVRSMIGTGIPVGWYVSCKPSGSQKIICNICGNWNVHTETCLYIK